MKLKKFFEMFLNESFKVNVFMLKNFAHFLNSKGINIDSSILITKGEELNLSTADDFIKKYPNSEIRKYAKEFFEEQELDYSGSSLVGDENEVEYYYGQDEEDYYDIDDDDEFEENNDDLNQMATMIHGMIEKTGIKKFYVSNKGFNISVQFVLERKEKFSRLMNIVGLIKKLKTDVLIQYDDEMDLWETKKGDPLLTFDFYYNEDAKGKVKKSDIPF